MKRITLCSPIPSTWQVDPRVAAAEPDGAARNGGRVVAIVDNGKLHGFADALKARLLARGTSEVQYYCRKYQEKAADDEFVAPIIARADLAVVGLGN